MISEWIHVIVCEGQNMLSIFHKLLHRPDLLAALVCGLIAAGIYLFSVRKKAFTPSPYVFYGICLFGGALGFPWLLNGQWYCALFQSAILFLFVSEPQYFSSLPSILLLCFSLIPVALYTKKREEYFMSLSITSAVISQALYVNFLFLPIG